MDNICRAQMAVVALDEVMNDHISQLQTLNRSLMSQDMRQDRNS